MAFYFFDFNYSLVNKMKKIEVIQGLYGLKKIRHFTSNGERDESLTKGNEIVEIMAYVEKYINENDFSIKQMDKEPGELTFLIEKD
jgi:hypothetical protein